MVGIVGQPKCAEAMFVGDVGRADVTFFVIIRVQVGGKVGFLAAGTFVPMVGIVGQPKCAEAMFVGDVGRTDVTFFVEIHVQVGGKAGFFAAGTFMPMVDIVGCPFRRKEVGMHGAGTGQCGIVGMGHPGDAGGPANTADKQRCDQQRQNGLGGYGSHDSVPLFWKIQFIIP